MFEVPRARREAWNSPSLQRENGLTNSITLDFCPPELREFISIALSHLFIVLCNRNSRKLIHSLLLLVQTSGLLNIKTISIIYSKFVYNILPANNYLKTNELTEYS